MDRVEFTVYEALSALHACNISTE